MMPDTPDAATDNQEGSGNELEHLDSHLCDIRSTSQHYLTVPHYWLSTFGRWAFSVVGPATRNSLPDRRTASVTWHSAVTVLDAC